MTWPTAGAPRGDGAPPGGAGDRGRPGGVRPLPPRAGATAQDGGAALQRRRAGVRVPPQGAGAPVGGPLRGEGSGDEGDGRRPVELRDARRRGAATAERAAGGRAAREGGRARRDAGRRLVAAHHHAHRLDGDGRRGGAPVKPLVTPAEMAEADRRTIASGTPVEVLMERAGRAVARGVRRRLGGTYGRRVVIVVGKGNNGGDGLVATRVLRSWGMRVATFALADGVDRRALARELDRADLVVDAMFGTGFRGGLSGDAGGVAEELERRPLPVIAVDIPSGVDGLTGALDGPGVRATETVTFAAVKPGLLFDPGREHAGDVDIADIGIDPGVVAAGITEEADVSAWLPARKPSTHKWEVGGVMVVGGHTGMTGAPMFVSHAAMRAGAGIVWCGVPGPDAAAAGSGSEVITLALPETDDGALDGRAAATVLRDLD